MRDYTLLMHNDVEIRELPKDDEQAG